MPTGRIDGLCPQDRARRAFAEFTWRRQEKRRRRGRDARPEGWHGSHECPIKSARSPSAAEAAVSSTP